MEVINRFKGLDLIRVPEERWMEVRDIVQEAVITCVILSRVPRKEKCKKVKRLSEEALQIAEIRETKGRGEKERYTYLNAVPKNSKEK